MKITKSDDMIQTSEKDLIDTLNAELDWEVIEKMILEKHKFTIQEDVGYKDGDLVVYKDQIAYKLDFDIKVGFSITFGRNGECLEITTTGETESVESEGGTSKNSEGENFLEDMSLKDDLTGMASNLADMMRDVNNP